MKTKIYPAFGLLAALVFMAATCATPVVSENTENTEQEELVKPVKTDQTQPIQGITYDPKEVFDGNKITKTDAEWKKSLTEKQYLVLRQHGTEAPRSGEYEQNKRKGVYYCAACGLPLYHSSTKFESGTGWPSFFKVIHEKNVGETVDNSHGMHRVEVHCNRCDGHLGHVFDDGPAPTGLRYCMNSAALYFQEEK